MINNKPNKSISLYKHKDTDNFSFNKIENIKFNKFKTSRKNSLEDISIKNKIDDINNINQFENSSLNLFIKQVKNMIRIECTIFQNKFIKVLLFEDKVSPEIILHKTINNMKKLNELYDFKNKNNSNIKGKEEISYKLYSFYEILQKYCELFIMNLKSIYRI